MIYLDNAATTRPNPRAAEKAAKFITEAYYNPSTRYGGGAFVSSQLQEARDFLTGAVADLQLFDMIFTSCGTEADNQAVFSCAKRGNAVTDAGEHAAIASCFTELKNRGVEPRIAPIHQDGSVDEEALLSLVDDKTSFVSVMHVNNETGAVNNILRLAHLVKKKNPRTVFHSDGVQAYGKIPIRLSGDIDLYSISAHKIGGLKGTGALLRRKKLALSPFVFGGGQEGNLRSGTENTFGIAFFRYAAEEKFQTLQADFTRLGALRTLFWELLDKSIFTRITPENGSPYILTVSARGLRGEVLQRTLWDRGVALGTGSACNSKKPHSKVLESCGYDPDVLDGVLRASFSNETREEDVRHAAEEMNAAATELKEKLWKK